MLAELLHVIATSWLYFGPFSEPLRGSVNASSVLNAVASNFTTDMFIRFECPYARRCIMDFYIDFRRFEKENTERNRLSFD